MPFDLALKSHQASLLLPPSIGAGELAKTGDDFMARAVVLSKVDNAQFISAIDRVCESVIKGDIDQNQARRELVAVLQKVGYSAEPGTEGTMQDLSSDQRLDLIIRMQVEMAYGYGQWRQGQTPAALQLWPCQEFYRAEARVEPRNWPLIWRQHGGQFYPGKSDYPEGRMIAPKNSPIWVAISRFGLPYRPFDFNSGMDLRDIERHVAYTLGVIAADAVIPPLTRDFAHDLQISAKSVSDAISQALDESLGDGYRLEGGIVVPNEQDLNLLALANLARIQQIENGVTIGNL